MSSLKLGPVIAIFILQSVSAFANVEEETCQKAQMILQGRQEILTEARNIRGAASDLCGNDRRTSQCRSSLQQDFQEARKRYYQALGQYNRSCLYE